MEWFQSVIKAASNFVWGPVAIAALVGTGLFLTVRLLLVQVRYLKHAVALISGRYDDPEDKGDITHFQALCAALSATIGIGNIAGVATALHLGGPGAIFWMWVTALVGSATKYTSCALSHKYRKLNEDGSASGGPMWTIERGMGRSWRWLGLLFATCTVVASFGIGNMVQANTVAVTLRSDWGIPTWLTGIVLTVLVFAVIVGGIKRIGAVASKLVPFMSVLYVVAAVAVIIINIEGVPGVFVMIVKDAFSGTAAAGGFVGSAMIMAIRWGVSRGLFSNESGLGSAPIAHAAAKTKEPVREGLVAMIGPYVDTIVICSMTAFAILLTGVWKEKFPMPDPMPAGKVKALKPGAAPGRFGGDSKYLKNLLYNGPVAVKAGRPGVALKLFLERGFVDDARLLVARGKGKPVPYTGRIVVDGGKLKLPEVMLKGTGKNSRPRLLLQGRRLQTGAVLTVEAFKKGLKTRWAGFVVTLGILLFGLSTAISWSYYGDRCVEYIAGPKAVLPYRLVYCACIFLGATVALRLVWDFSDVANACMAVPNLISLVVLSGVASRDLKEYFSRSHKPYK